MNTAIKYRHGRPILTPNALNKSVIQCKCIIQASSLAQCIDVWCHKRKGKKKKSYLDVNILVETIHLIEQFK